MPKIERILVPVDLTAASTAALQYGSFLAAKLGATVDILHVSKPSDVRGDDDVALLHRGVPGSSMESFNEQQIQLQLNDFVKAAGLNRTVRNDEIEQSKDPAAFIVKHASEKGYDLIVMGTHGRKGLDKFIQGSVTAKVVASSSVPVLTCHEAGK